MHLCNVINVNTFCNYQIHVSIIQYNVKEVKKKWNSHTVKFLFQLNCIAIKAQKF